MMKAKINKIIDSSVVDGPGNRTVIFFQGCNFNCLYCHNPETIHVCINCGECVSTCPNDALSIINGKIVWEKDSCLKCDRCIKGCNYDASPKILNLSVSEVLTHIKKNMPFIKGITTSGGECTLQIQFLTELFKETKQLGLTNFIDSNGSIRFSDYPELLKYTDAVMLDVKAFDKDEHIMLTSKTNELVLENAVYLASIGKLYEIRTVVIDKVLNNRKTVFEISKMLQNYHQIREIRYKIIRYRPIGVREKYINMKSPSNVELEMLKNIASENGLKNVIVV